MQLTVEPKDVSDAYSTPIVQQTSFWSRVKANLGMRSKAFEFSVRNSDLYTDVGGWSRTNADLLMFAQYCSSDEYVAYLPYGPEIEPSEENQGRFLEELSECLRSYLPKGCLAIRYDLNWQSHWCKEGDFDAEGNWRGCPRKEFQEMHMNYGTATWNLFKANMNVLPSDTIVVDLCGTEEQILASMKPKTRYNIGLARRKGRDGARGARPLVRPLLADGSPQRPARQRQALLRERHREPHAVFRSRGEREAPDGLP